MILITPPTNSKSSNLVDSLTLKQDFLSFFIFNSLFRVFFLVDLKFFLFRIFKESSEEFVRKAKKKKMFKYCAL